MRNSAEAERQNEKPIWGHLTAALFGILAGAMLAYPAPAAEAARNALTLWAKAVAPVLGPFMVCMLMISSRLRGGRSIRVVMAWLCGSPGGAKIFQNMGLQGRDALRYAAMTGTMSPMFFLGTVTGWLHAPAAGWLLLFCHLLGAWLTGLLIRKDASGEKDPACPAPAPLSLPAALQSCVPSLCVIALCMMLGSVAARMIQCALPCLPPMTAALLQCLMEVTAGTQALIALHPAPILPLVCAACSFSGLSILLQNASCWQESGLTLRSLLPLRLLHAAISGGICLLLSMIPSHIFPCAF